MIAECRPVAADVLIDPRGRSMPIRWQPHSAADLVERLYMAVLGRSADEPSRGQLIAAFVDGEISVRAQLARMLKSDEFFATQLGGRSSREIASTLYLTVLCRPAENEHILEETAGFIEACGWRVQVDSMLNSDEYLTRFGDDRIPQ